MNAQRAVQLSRLFLIGAIALLAALGTAGAVPAANSASYQDSVGEAPGAPDIAGVTVSNDDQGLISFEIRFANRNALAPLEELSIWLDTDARADTGLFGYDDFVDVSLDGATSFFRLNDLFFEPATLSAAIGPSMLTVRINASDLRGTRRFNFLLFGDSNPSDVNAPVDFAPDSLTTGWSYDVNIYVAPVLSLSGITVSPVPVRAGKVMTGKSTLTVTRAGLPETLTSQAKVTWTASIGALRLKPKSTANSPSGVLTSTWLVPANARGKQVRIKLAVTVEGVTVTKAYARRIG